MVCTVRFVLSTYFEIFPKNWKMVPSSYVLKYGQVHLRNLHNLYSC
jgi:hypothetical protein